MRASPDATRASEGRASGGGRRLLQRATADRTASVALVVVALVVVAAVFAPLLARHSPIATSFSHRYAPSSRSHPLGTDNLGRDELSRVLHGARISLGMTLAATAGITVVGVTLGMAAGTYGGVVDSVIMRLGDVELALPTLILALVIVGLLGQGLRNLIVTIMLVEWPRYARIVRGMALELRERQFVEAARSAGMGWPRVIIRHVLPNLVGPIVVLSTLDMGRVLLAISGLSFLGFGIAPPTPEWGAMLAEARTFLDRAPQLLIWPGLAISLMVLAFNLAGDGLRDVLDPRTAAPARRLARLARGART